MNRRRSTRSVHDRRRQGASWTRRERRRLWQLIVCLLLLLAAVYAKESGRAAPLRDRLDQYLHTDTDFKAVFSDLGRELSQAVPAGLFELPAASPTAAPSPETARPTAQAAPVPTASPAPTEPPEEEPPVAPTEEPMESVEYAGPALPDNTTMDKYVLGLEKTVAPVSGRVTSGFGWREHPIEGGSKFHYGVDLKAGEGTDVLAFADGTVEYIGEGSSYGRYIKLRHDNGVASFYAHCSKLCATQGEQVRAGEKIAESGSTGAVTGPHLHFELSKDAVRLDPAYYIDAP